VAKKTSFQNVPHLIFTDSFSLNNFEAPHKVAILGIHGSQV
jgi:hypothetical protein